MKEYIGFERKPLEFSYKDSKEYLYEYAERIMSRSQKRIDAQTGKLITGPHTAVEAVRGVFYYYLDELIKENGMDRVVNIVLGFLFEMEHDDIDPDLAFSVSWHIADFEKGDYEDLFCEEDLTQLKADIAKIKEYLKGYFKEHPEILEEVTEYIKDSDE